MQVTRLVTDDDAVSPVVGVILLVSITVILVAVVGTFVPGAEQRVDDTPSANFTFDFERTDDSGATSDPAGFLKVTHDGGDVIDHEQLYVRGEGFVAESDYGTGPSEWESGDFNPGGARYAHSSGRWPAAAASSEGSAVTAGDFVYVGVESDYEVTVNYQAAEGDESATLSDDEGPDA